MYLCAVIQGYTVNDSAKISAVLSETVQRYEQLYFIVSYFLI